MKKSFIATQSFGGVVLAAALAFSSFPATGQTPESPNAPRTSPLPAPRHGQPDSAKSFDLDVQGGIFVSESGAQSEATISRLAEHLREAGLNVVLSPGTEKIRISDVRLRSADARLIAEALSIASGGMLQANVRPGPVDTLIIMSRQRPSRRLEVFNISGYLAGHAWLADHDVHDKSTSAKAEEMTRRVREIEVLVIETLHDLTRSEFADHEKVEFQFHPGTRLLIVIGTDQAIDVARKIINALPGQRQPGGVAPAPPAESADQ